jgi:hypothetical protein
MRSKRDQTGEILIDHTFSPGITEDWANEVGLPDFVPVVGPGKRFETGVKACGHCGADVILNPQRTREREWCMGCDRYICDACGYQKKLGRSCKTLQQTLEELFTKHQNVRSF